MLDSVKEHEIASSVAVVPLELRALLTHGRQDDIFMISDASQRFKATGCMAQASSTFACTPDTSSRNTFSSHLWSAGPLSDSMHGTWGVFNYSSIEMVYVNDRKHRYHVTNEGEQPWSSVGAFDLCTRKPYRTFQLFLC